MIFVEVDDLIVNAELVAVIKKVDKDKCAFFTAGQPATDGGFLVNKSAIDFATDLLEESSDDEEEEE